MHTRYMHIQNARRHLRRQESSERMLDMDTQPQDRRRSNALEYGFQHLQGGGRGTRGRGGDDVPNKSKRPVAQCFGRPSRAEQARVAVFLVSRGAEDDDATRERGRGGHRAEAQRNP